MKVHICEKKLYIVEAYNACLFDKFISALLLYCHLATTMMKSYTRTASCWQLNKDIHNIFKQKIKCQVHSLN